MKLETFFEKFELFAEAPDAVARMREVVLELAVRGKLTEQKTEDTKDPEWQKLIALFDADIHQPSAIFQKPFVIPNSWKWATLEKLGNSKPRNDIAETTQCSFVPMKHIPSEYGCLVQHEERIWGEIKKGYTHFKNDDVVLAKITPCFENGKSAVMKGLTGGYGAGTTELHVFRRGSKAILPEFVLVYIKTRGFISRGEPQMTGSAGQKRVPHAYFARSPFPLPPLAEQKRIVAKVDELMALCDQLEAQQQERQARHAALVQASLARFTTTPTPANLQFLFHPSYTVSPANLRKTILTLAVQGKLVPQDPEDEPACASFPGLKPIISEADEIVPEQWVVCRYRELTSLVTSGSRGWKEFYSEKGAIFIRTQNIKTDALILDDVAFVDLPISVEGLRTQVAKDDILITITGANVTKAARIEEQIPEAYVSQHIALTRPRWPNMSKWLHLCFISDGAARGELVKLAYGDKPGLNLNNIRELILPLPPLAEQRRIVAKVNELMVLVDDLETQLAASRTVAHNLLAALVRELTTNP